MVAATSLFPTREVSPSEEPRIVLRGVSWAAYVGLRDAIESSTVRMTYLRGVLEIMSPSRAHGVEKKQIARLLELFCLERDIPLFGYGSTTLREEKKKRGLEADECYARGQDKATPDVALEVVKTHGSIDKLDVYRGLGVREVWVFEDGRFTIFALGADGYAVAPASVVLPEVPLERLAALEADQHAALRTLRDELRGRIVG